MTIILKETDAVVVGIGWTGTILARELTKAGLKVVGLERGAKRMPRENFTLPSVRDDLKYAVRQELFQDTQLGDRDAAPFAARRRRCRSGVSARSCRAPISAAPARTGTA